MSFSEPIDGPAAPDRNVQLVAWPSGSLAVQRQTTVAERTALCQEHDLERLDELGASMLLTWISDAKVHMTGTLNADVTQACVICCEPVRTQIRQPIERTFVLMADDDAEPLEIEVDPQAADVETVIGDSIDLLAIVQEEFALALPAYPRHPNEQFASEQPAVETSLADALRSALN
ncbi:MAG: DUF177 domain-containing protein [Geminicoccaceae bacterium]